MDVDLTNVRFADGIAFNFNDSPLGFILAAGQGIVIVNDMTGFTTRYPSVPASRIAGQYSGNLSDDGERLLLLATDSSILRDFTYNDKAPWPEAADGDGMTLTLIDPQSTPDHTDPFNWRASVAAGGSPGESDASSFAGDASEDSDLDTLSALGEYAFGSSDFDPADKPLPTGAVETLEVGNGDEEYFTISYQRNLASDDVRYEVQISTDLVNWVSGPGDVEFAHAVNNGDGTETVTYRSATVFGVQEREFLRVVVILK